MRWLRAVAAAAAAGVAAAGRLPASQAWTAATAAACLAFVIGSVVVWRRPASRVARAAVVLGAILLLAVPQPHDPALEVPAALGAAAVVVALYLNLPSGTSRPKLKGVPGPAAWRTALRAVPVLLLLGLAAALPWIGGRLLPERLAAVQEWSTPVGPLLVGLLLVLALVALGSLKAMAAPKDAAAQDPAEPEPVAEAAP